MIYIVISSKVSYESIITFKIRNHFFIVRYDYFYYDNGKCEMSDNNFRFNILYTKGTTFRLQALSQLGTVGRSPAKDQK